jgi:hypothetical protein
MSFVGYGTWSYMREEMAQVSEKRVVKGKFGAAREEVREGLKTFHNDELSCFFLPFAKYN